MTQDGVVVDSVVPRVPLFASDLPPGPIREIVQPITNHRRLLPRASAEWKGTLVAILNEDGKTVVRLLLREGEALLASGQGRIPLLSRLQCLPLKGYRSEEKKVTSFLRKTFDLKRETRTELTVVCDAVGQTPGDYSSSFHLALDPEVAVVKATKCIHLTLLRTLLANQEGVTRDWDTEFLHDFRIAIRRTRSALTQLKSVFPEADVARFSEEFQWLGTRTGPVRDMDVYLLKIPAYRAALHPGARRELEPLVRLLREKKKVEHRRLRRCLRSKRYYRLVEDWREFLKAPDGADSNLLNARRPIREVASERIWKAFNKVLNKGGKIGRNASAKELHRLRIDCKKLRYLITFFRSLYSAEALDPIIKELKRLQDHLGGFNDLQVQREALRSFAEEMMATEVGPPATLLAMGQLMGQLEGKQIQEREAFHEHYERFSRPKNQERFRELFGPAPGSDPKPPEGEKSP
jgi:CHAD domain-containing protein